ncbi:MAG TPA: MFS transporter [Candidatus Limnocylindrales bacterium]|nr:MFS transporter [Candidatus Limnocylindrales bacterium]
MAARADRFPALRSPVYRRFLLAAMVATVGGFMQSTAQGWLVLEITNSPGLLGVVAAAAGLPTLFLAAVAGVLADRLDRRRLLVATNLAGALFAAILALLTTLDAVEYWEVLVLAFLNGVALTVQMPATQAVVSTIVDRTSIGNAVALNSAQYNLARILAPAVAGIAIAAGGLAIGFWVNAVALLLVAVLLSGLAIPGPRELDRVQAALWRDLNDGLRYVAANRVLAIVVVLPAVPALFVLNYLTFIPVYARDILETGPLGLGLLTGSIGVGALVGALSVATLRPSGGSGRLMLTGLAVVAAGLSAFALSRSLPLSMLALAVMGAFQVTYYSTTNTLIQVLSPARLRGRILSLYVLTSIGLIPIANLVGGAIAERTGVPAVLAVGGAVTVVVAVLTAALEPRIAGLRAATLARQLPGSD